MKTLCLLADNCLVLSVKSLLHIQRVPMAEYVLNPIGAGMDYTMIFGSIYAAAQNFPVCFHQCCRRDRQKQIWQADSRRP